MTRTIKTGGAVVSNTKSPSVGQQAAPQVPRRPSKEEQRRAAAERQRRARAARREREDPEAAAREAAEAAEKAQAEANAKAADAAAKQERRARLEAQLTDAIAGTVEALAEGVQAFQLDEAGPHLGNRRARSIGESWAPILAPYIEESGMKHLPLILASTATTGAVLQWAGEYREYRAERDGRVKPRVRPVVVTQATQPQTATGAQA